jgi:ABC-type polysaccharide/polyol phosphate export permease
MFEPRSDPNRLAGAVSFIELVYHNTVRGVRRTHSNAVMAIFVTILQMIIFVGAFYLLFMVIGMRSAAIRGDFLLYIMTGVFLYMAHTRTVTAVAKSEGPSSAIMKHAPMTTAIAILAAALGALYTQLLAMGLILTVYHLWLGPISIHDPASALGMVVLAWFSGLAVGLCFLAIKPWAPTFASMGTQVYTRANMIASGKMFVANQMPGYMLMFFDWNPLFHTIDQARGFTFINYFPHNSSLTYPIWVTLALLMLGLMGEFYTRKHASLSWSARQ